MEQNDSSGTNRKIAKASAILMAASIAGHALSLGKEMLVANYFGITRAMDAYYAAMSVVNWITPIFASPFVLIFTPIFAKYKTLDKKEADTLAATLINGVLAALSVALIAVFIFSDQIMRYAFSGLDPSARVLASGLLRILCVSTLFGVLATICTAILNVNEHFFWPSVSTMFVSLSTMSMLFLFADTKGAYVFAWGMLLGLVLQFLFLAPMLHRYGYRHSFVAVVDHIEIRNALKSYATLSAMAVIAGAGGVVNRVMAAWLPTGSISALGYADKLVQVPLVIFSGSVVTAIYPYFSGQIAGNKMEDMKHTLAVSIRMGGFIFAPITALMMTLSAPVVALLFQRGAFDASATALTSTVLIFCAFQLFPVYSLAVMQRLVFAFQDVASVARITAASIALTIALNYIFMKTINPPAAGIALSGAVVCVISAFLYSVALKKRMKNLHGILILKSLAAISLAAAVAGAATRLAFGYLSTIQYQAIAPAIAGSFVVAASAVTGGVVYAAIAVLFKFEEAQKVIAAVKSKISPRKAGI